MVVEVGLGGPRPRADDGAAGGAQRHAPCTVVEEPVPARAHLLPPAPWHLLRAASMVVNRCASELYRWWTTRAIALEPTRPVPMRGSPVTGWRAPRVPPETEHLLLLLVGLHVVVAEEGGTITWPAGTSPSSMECPRAWRTATAGHRTTSPEQGRTRGRRGPVSSSSMGKERMLVGPFSLCARAGCSVDVDGTTGRARTGQWLPSSTCCMVISDLFGRTLDRHWLAPLSARSGCLGLGAARSGGRGLPRGVEPNLAFATRVCRHDVRRTGSGWRSACCSMVRRGISRQDPPAACWPAGRPPLRDVARRQQLLGDK